MDHISLYELLFDLIKIFRGVEKLPYAPTWPEKPETKVFVASFDTHFASNLCRFVDLPDLNYIPKTDL